MLLDRRAMLLGASCFAVGAMNDAYGQSLPAPMPPALTPTGTVRSLYERAIVIDALADVTSANRPALADPSRSSEEVVNVRASGLTAVNLTVDEDTFASTVEHVGFWLKQIEQHPDLYLHVRAHSDLLRAKSEKKLGLILGFQGAHPIGADPSLLELFARLGVRIIQLTYNDRNRLGDGCLVPENRGLTAFGRDVVARLNELRIVVDLSHAGVQTAYEGVTASKRPPILSHTSCRAIFDHPRAQPDQVLKACADQGGVVGIYLMPFLGRDPVYPSPALLLRHLKHALAVCGEDHVGIGSDLSIHPVTVNEAYMRMHLEEVADRRRRGIATPLDELPLVIPELNSPRRLELIAEGLVASGESERVAEKVIGGNFSRVFQEVWGV